MLALIFSLITAPAFAADSSRLSCETGDLCKLRVCHVSQAGKQERKLQEKVEPVRVEYRLQPQANMAYSVAHAELVFQRGSVGESRVEYSDSKMDFTLRTAYLEKGSQLVSELKSSESEVTLLVLQFEGVRKNKEKAKLLLLSRNFRGDYVLREFSLKCEDRATR